MGKDGVGPGCGRACRLLSRCSSPMSDSTEKPQSQPAMADAPCWHPGRGVTGLHAQTPLKGAACQLSLYRAPEPPPSAHDVGVRVDSDIRS